ncbi:MAG: ATP-binding protein [Deltaproteobacteria bacterium]|nr:ATP-binding protein [Deltaproteobacteria bacterium]
MSGITLPARTENLEALIGFISRFAQKRGFSEKRTRQIELAAEEALVNVVKYAYPDQGNPDVEVRCETADGGRLHIHIIDSGVPFHSEDVMPPDLEAGISERKVGGLGLLLMEKMADAVHRRREGGRNILTLTINEETGSDREK